MESNAAAPARPSLAPTLLVAAAFVVVSLIFVASRDWYLFWKTVHVVFAVIWVGGGTLFAVLGLRAERLGGDEMLAVIRQGAAVGEKLFTPSSFVVLVTGIAMMYAGPGEFWEWGSFWILFGLAGFAATFVVGMALLAPTAKRLRALMESEGPGSPATQATISRLLLISRVDTAILLLVVVDMTVKPFL